MFLAPAAEFPNDNPALHRGSIWVNREPCGPLEMEAPELEDVVVAALTETALPPAVVEPEQPISVLAIPAAPQPVSDSDSDSDSDPAPAPLESLIVLSAAPRGEVEALLVDEEIVIEELDFDLSNVPIEPAMPAAPTPETPPPAAEEDVYAILVQTLSDLVVAEGGTAEAVIALLDGPEQPAAHAWRAVLRGENDDISSCGSAMLDEWAASIVAAALGNPARANALKPYLRSRGVCAFGLIAA